MADTAFVLIVEDESSHGEAIKEGLARAGHACLLVDSVDEAIRSMERRQPHVVVTDYRLGHNGNGLDVLRKARQLSPWTQVILITAHGDEKLAREAFVHGGVYDYLTKPIDIEELRGRVSSAARKAMAERESQALVTQFEKATHFEGVIATSSAMRSVMDRVRRIARSKLTVLITGESGTGKELIARAIHNLSDRRSKPWIPLNCAGITESILESELFGHVKGAFTSAHSDRRGLFEEADGGTIFLDEIGDMPVSMQAKLLRVLESGEIVRVGTSRPVHVDVRVVAATNRDLKQAVTEKTFREDLFYRIKQAEVYLLPLRQRKEDISPLLQHFLHEANALYGKNVRHMTPEVLRMLHNYEWPGNVREMKNVIDQMVVLSDRDTLDVGDIPPDTPIRTSTEIVPVTPHITNMTFPEMEKRLIQVALAQHDGNREKAAKQLGIGARTLYRKLKEYGLK